MESPSSCCPIPAADWRCMPPESNNGSSGSAFLSNLTGSTSPSSSPGSASEAPWNQGGYPDMGGQQRPSTAAQSRPSLEGALPEAIYGQEFSAALLRSASTACNHQRGLYGPESSEFAVSSRRRSMSSICPSVAEERIQLQMQHQLQREEKKQQILAAAAAMAAGPNAGTVPHGSHLGTMRPQPLSHEKIFLTGHGASNTAPRSGPMQPVTPRMDMMPRSPSQTNCRNWTEVEDLCKSMDVAGMRIEDLDILCLPPLDGENEPIEQHDPAQKSDVLISLKFSDMSLRHYPGDHHAKQLFSEALSK